MTAAADRPPRPRAGFLGPAGTFTEEALFASAEPDAVEPVPLPGIYETVAALRSGDVELAIVPIENSLEGSINVTLDLLADDADLRIVGEAALGVHHCLIAAAPVALEQISRVVTHPQVPGQCRRFLRAELPGAAILAASSTAEAVRSVVAGGEPDTAAIGTALAAEIYGGEILREGVEDRADNETRFVWLAREELAGARPAGVRSASGEPRCSIVFWGEEAGRPGWLVRCLGEFAERGINLTKIESRPRRERLGSYMFFVDLAGAEDEPRVAAALSGLRSLCDRVQVLGSYRAASPAAARTTSPAGGA